ncbi:MAG: hypothetical protein D6802_07315 [Ardenticatenia bacterium]|nr:MAG: hypothetical protein D6802_07315 [Ardenticatenia bacterium]
MKGTRRFWLFMLAFGIAMLLSGVVFAASTIVVDVFETAQTVCAGANVSCGSNSGTVVSVAGDILGDERDMQIPGISTGLNGVTLTAGSRLLWFKQDPGTGADAQVVWDGADGDATQVSTNTLSTSFGGHSHFLLTFVPTTEAMEGSLTVYCTGNSGVLTQTFPLQIPIVGSGEYVDYVMPFSPTLSTSCVDTIHAIEMMLLGSAAAGNDVVMSSFVVTTALDYNDLDGYPTASHIPDGLRLGKKVDAENTAHLSTTGLGDDSDRQADEDGVIRALNTQWLANRVVTLTVTVNGCRTGTCYLNGWIDWRKNINYTDSDDHIWDDVSVSNGVHQLTTTVPSDVNLSNATGIAARFRICPTANTCNTPDATNVVGGEVEEYLWNFGPTAVEIASFDGSTLTVQGGWKDPRIAALLMFALGGTLILWQRRMRAT